VDVQLIVSAAQVDSMKSETSIPKVNRTNLMETMFSSITPGNSISSSVGVQLSNIVNVVLFLLLVSVSLNLIGANLRAGYGQTILSSETVSSKAAEALGGTNAIQQIKNISIIADGERYEPGQKFSPEEYPKHVSSFHYNFDSGSSQ
jgi:uncharacterized protein YegP (UPF0339 family)